MSDADTTTSYATESIVVGGELVIKPLLAHSQNLTEIKTAQGAVLINLSPNDIEMLQFGKTRSWYRA